MNIQLISERTSSELDLLLKLWERSVRASHDFLSEADIENLRPFIKPAFESIDKLFVVKSDDEKFLAFMGLEDKKIEMLFVDPKYFSQGIGKELVFHAFEYFGATLVDVNEQNGKALAFYKHLGFVVYSRSELDEQGNPFPILHLKI